MPRSFSSAVVPAHPDRVWSLVRDFGAAPTYIESVATTTLSSAADRIGCERTSTLHDGAAVVEVLTALDDTARSLSYRLTEGPFPFTNYAATMHVVPVSADGSSFVEWWSTYDCEAADATKLDEILVGGLYAPALAFLQRHFGS